jgi:hypothetical protein
MFTTAGPARVTASANERRGSDPCGAGESVAAADAAAVDAAVGASSSQGRINKSSAAPANPTSAHLSRKTQVCRSVGTVKIVGRAMEEREGRHVRNQVPRQQSAAIDVYNAEFLEGLKLRMPAWWTNGVRDVPGCALT